MTFLHFARNSGRQELLDIFLPLYIDARPRNNVNIPSQFLGFRLPSFGTLSPSPGQIYRVCPLGTYPSTR
jgi:hypothetical protein